MGEGIGIGRRHRPRPLFGYIAGASETGAPLRRNREDFAEYAFGPCVLGDVPKQSTRTTILEENYSAPFGIAPMVISAPMAYRGVLFSLKGKPSRNPDDHERVLVAGRLFVTLQAYKAN